MHLGRTFAGRVRIVTLGRSTYVQPKGGGARMQYHKLKPEQRRIRNDRRRAYARATAIQDEVFKQTGKWIDRKEALRMAWKEIRR